MSPEQFTDLYRLVMAGFSLLGVLMVLSTAAIMVCLAERGQSDFPDSELEDGNEKALRPRTPGLPSEPGVTD